MSVISFKDIAFQLQYSSNQIDGVYAFLDLIDKPDRVFERMELFLVKNNLPHTFLKWIETNPDVNGVLFENHIIIPRDTESLDWEQVFYD